VPIERPFVKRDWRFGKYRFDGLQDPLSCLMRVLGCMLLGWPRVLLRGTILPDVDDLESESESESESKPQPELE
jgi:hypothetical protein